MIWVFYLIGGAAIFGGLLLLTRKLELRLKWAVPWALTASAVCLWLASRLSVLVPGLTVILQIILAFGLSVAVSVLIVLALFFRDPRRTPPGEERTILSPADGRIIYIKELDGDRFPIAVKKGRDIPLTEFTGEPFPLKRGLQIGIMMSYLDVHINRAPIAGKVERIKRIRGAFHSLKLMDSLLENERVFSVIRGPAFTVGMVQIASRLVRRIVPFIKEGDDVRQGDRIGMIRFGSQVDLLLPGRDDLVVVTKVGDYVKAGLSVLARFGHRAGTA
jgi:phosphatidylserine decarboxylase